MSEYIKKLENILEGVENYRFDDASCAEWEELTTHVLKGAIAREKANQEAYELASSVWNKLERKLPEQKLNENQKVVLGWLKNQSKNNLAPILMLSKFGWEHFGDELPKDIAKAYQALNDRKDDLEILQAFATWALDQC